MSTIFFFLVEEDNMVFMLSTLSNKNYELYRVIVTTFEKIKVKGIAAPKVDCKGSNFRGLRGFSETECTEMLQKCASGETVLKFNLRQPKKNEKNLGIICIFSWH